MRGLVALGRSILDRVDPRAVFAAAFLLILVFGVLGGLDYNSHLDINGRPMHLFNLDGEGTPPAAYSALLLVAACVATLYVAADVPAGRLRWRILGAFYAFMSVDEAVKIHERLQSALHVAWLKLYLPVMAVAAVAALICLLSIRDNRAGVALLVGGGACWSVAQILEKLEANPTQGKVAGYWIYATFEECLEMTGSLLFLLAAVVVLQRRRAARSAIDVAYAVPEPSRASSTRPTASSSATTDVSMTRSASSGTS